METKTEDAEQTRHSRRLDQLVRRRRIRAKLTTAAALDETLCSIQDAGHDMFQLFQFHGKITAETLDVGLGKGEVGMTMEPCFVITYAEAS